MPGRARPIPTTLRSAPFSTGAAIALGVSRRRMRVLDLRRPFVGVRSTEESGTAVLGLVREYLPILAVGEFFSHTTSARLHGMWLPLHLEQELRLHVSVHKPQRAPRNRRIVGHHLVPRDLLLVRWKSIPVAGEVETWCQLATVLSLRDLIVAGDSLLAKGRPHPASTLRAMRAAAADPFRPRAKALRAAIGLVRIGHRSAQESRLRLLLHAAGLPEFEINAEIFDERGERVAEGDLVHRGRMVVLEYEGDQHRTDRGQFRSDLLKYERLQDLAWQVVRVTKDDLEVHRGEFIARVEAFFAD